jgi:hypothetical protein
MTYQSKLTAYSSPAYEVAERIAASYGETVTDITLGSEELIGKKDVEEFLRAVADSKDSSRDAKIRIK